MSSPLRKLVVGLALVMTVLIAGAPAASACSPLYTSSIERFLPDDLGPP